MPLDWALALKSMNTPINFTVNFHLVKGQEVALARNEIVRFAIEKEAKYLFFLGDDVVPPSHTIKQFIYRMEQDSSIGIIGGVYVNKDDHPAPLVFRGNGQGSYWDWKVGEFFEVTGLGMDCNLIRVEVLKLLKDNWYKTVDKDGYVDGENKAETWTEDLFFYKRVAEETKYKIYCDASIICAHWDVYGNKSYTLPPDSLPMRRKMVEKDKKALVLGEQLNINPEEIDEFDITTAGPQEQADYRTTLHTLPFGSDSFDWVLVNDPLYNTDVSEYLRVLKVGGKITMAFRGIIDRAQLLSIIPNSKVVGQFLEVKK